MVYLDNAATTKPKFFAKDYEKYWANPNSSYKLGIKASKQLDTAKLKIMDSLGLNNGTILFCRCATEAVEWIYKSFKDKNSNSIVLSSEYEHDSVFNVIDRVTNFSKTDVEGADLLYLCQLVNHITGAVTDIEYIETLMRGNGRFFGSDITAALGKYKIPNNLGKYYDVVWFSGRKIHCETMGAIWVSDRIYNHLIKRNQEINIHGTPNVPGAIALADAVYYVTNNLKKNELKWEELYKLLISSLKNNNIEFHVIGDNLVRSKAINAIMFDGINGDALTQYLSDKGIYISPGHSACGENGNYRELIAFGLTEKEAEQTIRVSFSEDTTIKDIKTFISGVKQYKETFM